MTRFRQACGPFYIVAGVMHFVIPKVYKRIVPPYLPAPEFLVYASGVAEIVGGAAIMVPATRRRGGWWLIATTLAVFPANLYMAQTPEKFSDIPGGETTLKARLPLQLGFLGWIVSAMRDR